MALHHDLLEDERIVCCRGWICPQYVAIRAFAKCIMLCK